MSIWKAIVHMYQQGLPPKPRFSVDDIPDLSGQVMIVTGGNTGVGKETIKALLNHNARVYMAARSPDRAKQAIKELEAETGKTALFLKLDLSNLQSIKAAAIEFQSKETQLHVLFNNAAVMVPPLDALTADGYDMQFGTNVLGHFYFTQLLLPTLQGTAKNTGEPARVVTTASSAHVHPFMKFNFATLRDGRARRRVGRERLYAQSKLGNILVAQELARRYGAHGIVATSLNPGNLRSELTRHVESRFLAAFIHMCFWPVPYGALTQLYAGTMPEGADLNGKYLIPWARVGSARKDALDPKLSADLWRWLEEQVKNL